MSAKTTARLGLLTALALILGYIESLFSVAPGLPGVKIGLSNCVLLYCVYEMRVRDASLVLLLKVTLSSLLFGGVSSLFYGFAGGSFSLALMLLLHRQGGISLPLVSVAGALSHSVGQLLVAALLLGAGAALSYAPVLLLFSLFAGILTGLLTLALLRALKNAGKG